MYLPADSVSQISALNALCMAYRDTVECPEQPEYYKYTGDRRFTYFHSTKLIYLIIYTYRSQVHEAPS